MSVARRTVMCLLFSLTAAATPVLAAQGFTLSGTVLTTGGRPVTGAIVAIDTAAGRRDTRTNAEGAFTLTNVPGGPGHLSVRAEGYLIAHQDLTVSATTPRIEVRLIVEPHFSEVVSVSPNARSAFESYQPTSVLGGQDLAVSLKGTLGATLDLQPGVATRSFGPGPARPVIRGLDGDRVLVLKDSQRLGDLSSQSGDHGLNINPASAERIEVVRGPATLLFGANAIGGLVNVITNTIPTSVVRRPMGSVTFDAGSAAAEGGGAGSLTVGRGAFAANIAASGRRSGDFATPAGDVPNSFGRSGFVEGGVSRVGENGYIGGGIGYDRTRYGLPFVEHGETSLNPRRRTFDFRSERRNLGGFVESFRASASVRRYEHDELDDTTVETSLKNNTVEFGLLANHRPAGRLKGTLGATFLTREFEAIGDEALSPPVDQKAFAALLYEEASLTPHVTLQFGGRFDYTDFNPAGGLMPRTFRNGSASVGLLVKATDQASIALSLASASRNPALEELYFEGPHPGNAVIEQGEDALATERATGFDAAVRWQAPRMSGEVTYFFNFVDNFIFRQLTGVIDPVENLPETFFTQGDARLQGVEGHLDVRASEMLSFEAGVDYVRGHLTALDAPLPRMPPLRARLGLRVQRLAFRAGIDGTFTGRQSRIFTVGGVGETPTGGYALGKIFAAYSFTQGAATSTIGIHLDNVANRLYRNHLNYLKDLAPEMGRDVRITYTVSFR